MRRTVVLVSSLVFVLSACGSDKNAASPSSSSTSTSTAPVSAATTTTTAPSTSTSAEITTTTGVKCPNLGTTKPTGTPANQPAALLTDVAVTTAGCRDSVTFTFEKSGSAVPSCTVAYQPGPFTDDASGAPVTVAGSAFLTLRCYPAYGYDFVSGVTTYTGPKHITPTGTRHVREVVKTGDSEGVLNWVIGLDQQRAYGISAGGVPTRQLRITFS
jgi:hypothetical protein